jgi:prepilin-type N-terminal cleavage/methylation domain-containing protein
MHRPPHPTGRAFTLIELAIVLAVIGILVGAVVAGSSMLRQSELQTIIADYSKYSNAVAQFSKQYGGLPGDLLDATNYWGDDNTNCPDAAVTNGTPGTCNGNGDGQINSAGFVTGMSINEPFRAWQHLQLANYIDGNYTGISAATSPQYLTAALGTNAPKSRITNAGWTIYNYSAFGVDQYNLTSNLKNILIFGAVSGNNLTRGMAITPTEAWQVDKKIDDTLPATGRVMTWKPMTLANCATSAVDASATYKVTYADKACSLMMSIPIK